MKHLLRLALLFAASFLLLILNIEAAANISFTNGGKRSRKDNPAAWQKYEFMRLRDPKTNKIPDNIRSLELKYAGTLPTVEEVGLRKGMEKPLSLSWKSIGPYNIGGRTRALTVDVSNENVILAGGVSGGMWRSTNDGQSWYKTTKPDQLQSVTCIAQDTRPGHTNVFYYGTGEVIGNTASGYDPFSFYTGDGIFKSTDDGQSWFPLPSTQHNSPQNWAYNFQTVWNVATDPSNSGHNIIYAATWGAIERSTDGGNTWYTVLGTGYGEFTDVSVTSTGVVYAALSSDANQYAGIWRSTTGDAGTFVNITPGGWPTVYNRIVMAAAPSDQNQVYFLAETPGAGKVLIEENGSTDGHSLWKYTDGVQSPWVDISQNLPAFGGTDGNFDSQGSYDLLIKVKPDDPNFVIIGGTNLYRSTNGFSTPIDSSDWIGGNPLVMNQYDVYPNQHPDEHALVFLPSNPDTVISGSDGGVSESYNVTASNVTWTSLNNGYITTQFYSVAMDQAASGDNVVIGGLQDIGDCFYNSTDPSAGWVVIPYTGDGTITAIANNKAYYYFGDYNGYITRATLDAQGNQTSWTNFKPVGASNFLFVTPYVLDPDNSNIMYMAAGDSIWRNSNLSGIPNYVNDSTGVNWTVMNNTAKGDVITAIGISKTPANILYYGTETGEVYRVDNANTGDPVPKDIWTGKGLSDGAYVTCIAVDPDNANNVILVYSNYNVISLYYTSDGGNNWNDVAGNLEQNPDGSGDGPSCRWASILNYGGTTYYFVSTSTGVYSTIQLNGTSTVWAQEGANTIGNLVCDMVISRETDGKVVVGTHGNGVYYTNVSGGTPVNTGDVLLSFDNNLTPTGGIFSSKSDAVIADRLTAPVSTFKITKIIYYIKGDSSGGSGSFAPYEDASVNSNEVLTPATYGIVMNTYTPVSMPGWDTVETSISVAPTANYVDKEFFVGLEYDGVHKTGLGYDSTASNGRGWYREGNIYSNWYPLDSLGWHITLYIRAEISTVTAVDELSTQIPKEFNLFQNYPNPFNPSTTIEYDLPKNENVKLKVFDILGRKVATLVDANQAAGKYSITWNGRNNRGTVLASGIYLYSFVAGKYKAVKKMLYLK